MGRGAGSDASMATTQDAMRTGALVNTRDLARGASVLGR